MCLISSFAQEAVRHYFFSSLTHGLRGTGDVVNSIKTDCGWRGHGAKLSMEAVGLVSVCCLT